MDKPQFCSCQLLNVSVALHHPKVSTSTHTFKMCSSMTTLISLKKQLGIKTWVSDVLDNLFQKVFGDCDWALLLLLELWQARCVPAVLTHETY